MTLTEKLHALFSGSATQLAAEPTTPQTTEPVALAKAKLDGGQEIETTAETFAPGADVFVTNDQGEQIALPDGEYTLEDGTKFLVAAGTIAEAAEEPAEPEQMAANLEAEPLTREEVNGMIQKAVLQLAKQVEEELNANAEHLQKLSAQPAAKVQRVQTQNVQLSNHELAKMDLDTRIKTMIQQYR